MAAPPLIMVATMVPLIVVVLPRVSKHRSEITMSSNLGCHCAMKVDMVADMKVDMVADMKVDMVADKKVHMSATMSTFMSATIMVVLPRVSDHRSEKNPELQSWLPLSYVRAL